MTKLAFMGNGETSANLLKTFSKMTPGRTGRWKNLVGVPDPKNADYVMVIDRLPGRGVAPPADKLIYMGAHPPAAPGHYVDMTNLPCRAKFDCANTFGFGEWWIKYDYDQLKAMSEPEHGSRDRKLGCIVSDARTRDYHKARIDWLHRFCDTHQGLPLDLHGRIEPTGSLTEYYKGVCGDKRQHVGVDYWSGKEGVYESHQFMLEFDSPGDHYFSERVFDCVLLWAVPLYWGGGGVAKYLPKGSNWGLDINGNGDDVLAYLAQHPYVDHVPALAEARQLLLDRYQVWPRLHEVLFGEP